MELSESSEEEDAEDACPSKSSSGGGCGNICECTDERCCLCRLFDKGDYDDIGNVPFFGVIPTDVEGSPFLDATIRQEFHCNRCGTIPVGRIYQCHKGHLICEGCHQVQVLDKMLFQALGTCPKCSARMYRHAPNRNIIAERILSEMKMTCEYCGAKMVRAALRSHFHSECQGRLVSCKYKRIGCPWYGPASEIAAHDETCEFPGKTGAELMEYLRPIQAERDARLQILAKIEDTLLRSQLTVRLLHVLPQGPIRKFPHNEFVLVNEFRTHFMKWSLLIMWQSPAADDDHPQPMGSLHFRLKIERPENSSSSLVFTYALVHGSHSEVAFLPNLCDRIEFSSNQLLGPPVMIYRHTMSHCKKLLIDRGIYARLLITRHDSRLPL
ncbi:GL26080 [Drosophila persimilis]|uniref:GL26080 n=1 Tax=Drosophila persimilis TaxID=7234 RepID=B4GKH0_DROPE|nr:cysteine and histidine-rich protein 1 [Drosophila persimilis]EDW37136.1 GL26080 [Drosophila persimilis]